MPLAPCLISPGVAFLRSDAGHNSFPMGQPVLRQEDVLCTDEHAGEPFPLHGSRRAWQSRSRGFSADDQRRGVAGIELAFAAGVGLSVKIGNHFLQL
jgi:hypothetical protein